MNLYRFVFSRTRHAFVAWVAFFSVVANGFSDETPGKPAPAPLAYTDTWIGNTYGQGDGRWIQNNILGLYVNAEGVVYTNSWWDEGRRESGVYSGKDGEPVGMLDSLHDSFGGGFAITGDDNFVYSANWDAVRRCKPDGRPAPFPGGRGPRGDSIGVSTLPTGKDKSRGVRGLGVDRVNRRLFVSENNDNELQVWDTATMTRLGKLPVERPGPLAVAADGTVWIICRKENEREAKVLHYQPNGIKLPQEISDGRGFDPTGIWFDAKNNRLLIADNGPDQNIKIYRNLLTARTAPDATFGAGIFSGTPGEVTRAKFGTSGLTGVATDAAGNFYVSMNGVGPQSFWHGGGTVLESWTPAGELRWRKLGLAFVDSADVDPLSDVNETLDAYDKYSHYRLDLNKTTAGTEWSYAGRTLNQIKYPFDPRFVRSGDGWDYTGGTLVRNVQGHKLLYVLSMQARRLLIFRFDPAAEGETAIPAGLWESQGGYDAGYPNAPRGKDFFWRDRNGDGTFDADEFVVGPGMPNLGFGLWVDSAGDVWSCNHWAKSGVGIRRWKMQGFDDRGNPIYDYSPGNYTEYQRPEGCHGELRRLEYFPESDTMYVSSTNVSDGDRDAGNRIVRYDHWSSDRRTVAWTLDPPMDKTKISAISVAGEYLFLGYSYFSTNSREGTIRVHRVADGAYVGEMTPTPAVGSLSGTFDIPYAIRAFQRRNGEYLVFAEDDHFAKIVVHRWSPTSEAVVVDTLDDLNRVNQRLGTAGWTVDRSNPTQFNKDTGRATRTSDTAQALVWNVSNLHDFAAAIYYDAKLNVDTLVSFAASVDGERWTPVSTAATPATGSGGGWNVITYRPTDGALPAGARHLKLQIAPSGVSWNVQVGRVEMFGTAKPGNSFP